mgnify:CR=1 FL=1
MGGEVNGKLSLADEAGLFHPLQELFLLKQGIFAGFFVVEFPDFHEGIEEEADRAGVGILGVEASAGHEFGGGGGNGSFGVGKMVEGAEEEAGVDAVVGNGGGFGVGGDEVDVAGDALAEGALEADGEHFLGDVEAKAVDLAGGDGEGGFAGAGPEVEEDVTGVEPGVGAGVEVGLVEGGVEGKLFDFLAVVACVVAEEVDLAALHAVGFGGDVRGGFDSMTGGKGGIEVVAAKVEGEEVEDAVFDAVPAVGGRGEDAAFDDLSVFLAEDFEGEVGGSGVGAKKTFEGLGIHGGGIGTTERRGRSTSKRPGFSLGRIRRGGYERATEQEAVY